MEHRVASLKDLPASLTALLHDWTDERSISIEIDDVQSNVSREMVRVNLSIFRFFASTEDKSYGAAIGRRIRMVELDISYGTAQAFHNGKRMAMCARTVFEVTIVKDMCNIFGTLHGGCAAYMTDLCSTSSLVALGIANSMDSTGLSQAMNLIWHKPVKVGTTLRIESTSVFQEGRIRVCRCEMWDRQYLCVSAVHSISTLSCSPFKNAKL